MKIQRIVANPRLFALVLTLVIALFVMGAGTFTLFRKWEWALYDFRLNLLGRLNKLDSRIIIIGIDAKTIEDEKQSPPFPRGKYARLLGKIEKYSPSAVAFDMTFDTPDRYGPENDADFANSLKYSGKCVLGNIISRTPPSFLSKTELHVTDPIEKLDQSCARVGYVNIDPDPDNVARKVKLAAFDGKKWHLQFDLAALSLMEGISPEEIRFEKNRIIMGKRIIPTLENHWIFINYRLSNMFHSKSESLDMGWTGMSTFVNKPPDYMPKNCLYLVGACFPESGDSRKTPVMEKNGIMYGIKIHSNILNTLLQGSYIYQLPEIWDNILTCAIIIVLAFLLGTILPKVNALWGTLFSALALICYTSINFFLFHKGILIQFVGPFITILVSFTVIETYQFLRTHRLFQQFLPAEYVDDMLRDPTMQKLGGTQKEATILFSDIRGYTNLSEKMDPDSVMKMLNKYHSKMFTCFQDNNGRVFDYQGDAQMVVFGAVKKSKNHALDAVKCALSMQEALQELMKNWHMEGEHTFEVGIGICTGMIAYGNVGSEDHKQLVAIGDSTNTAARLQSLSSKVGSPIIIHHKTYEYVKGKIECEELEPVELKGKKEPQRIFKVVIHKGENSMPEGSR